MAHLERLHSKPPLHTAQMPVSCDDQQALPQTGGSQALLPIWFSVAEQSAKQSSQEIFTVQTLQGLLVRQSTGLDLAWQAI